MYMPILLPVSSARRNTFAVEVLQPDGHDARCTRCRSTIYHSPL